ncbi:MAG TPA: YARHG domain-containing protein [Pyrinomonadaceae bacterium]|nr:YARHG domain-containing protein [Pyrinomonadaceae bacterium]
MTKHPLRSLLTALALVVAFQAAAFGAEESEFTKKWEAVDFAKQQLTREELKGVPLDELKLLRGIVFGRHGRVFKDWEIKYYLGERPWYKPNPNFQNSMLGDTERRNLDLIRELEALAHEKIEPGDLRWWQARPIKDEHLGEYTAAEWRVLRAEVEAVHGRRFDDQPWLQNYFEERYWYRADPAYDPRKLTDTERRNMATIDAAHNKQRKTALSPGDMEHFQKTLLTPEMLKGLNLHELRLLRNEVYARRGRQFRTEWLAQWFYTQPWYEPTPEFAEVELSEVERKNVELIVSYENRLHEELSTKPVTESLLEGMFLEDARKLRQEIYARRGRVFRDRWLQKYFESFAWYKPDPRFRETALTAVEKKNVETILTYEKKATSVADAVEG